MEVINTVAFLNRCVFVLCRHRLPLDQWWLVLRPLIKVLARSKKHGFEGERYKAERDEPEASVSDWTELS